MTPEEAEKAAAGAHEVTIPLSVPVKFNGAECSELTLRRMTVGDMISVDHLKASDAERELALIAKLARVSPKELEQLDMADYDLCQSALMGFRSGPIRRGE